MTLSAVNRKSGPYVADGVTTSFTYNFKIFSASDLAVYVGTVLQPSSVYSVTGVGADAGGSVVFTTAPTSGVIWIFGELPQEQQDVDIELGGRIDSVSLEKGFDKLVMLINEVSVDNERRPAFRNTIGTALRNMAIPDPVALKVLQFNATADGFTLADAAILKATVPTTTQFQLSEPSTPVEVTPGVGALEGVASAYVPAGIILFGVVAYVKTTLGNSSGLTTFSLGTSEDRSKWGSGIARTITTETNVGQFLVYQPEPISSALDVVITADAGTFDGTGVVVLTYSGFSITPLQTA